MRERKILLDLDDDDLGVIKQHNIVPRMSSSPGTFRIPAPKLGEHTNEVMIEAGFDRKKINELYKQGVI